MKSENEKDEAFIRRAIELARQGVGLTSPNPCVGAIIVEGSDEVAGSGFHTYAGVKHAEVLAIEEAGARTKGATIYVNLEPCSHTGRTGPCADAIIAAGIRRVVVSMKDPNPVVAGRGFARLREAGIEVTTGILEADARRLNESFGKYVARGTPLVTLKAAMTLDGKIASGKSNSPKQWITGEAARAHVQELRHESDAILVGIGTVLADNPLLTDRTGRARRRPLLRVVLDSHLRLPVDSELAKTANSDVLVFCSTAPAQGKRQLEDQGIRVEEVVGADSRVDLTAVIKRLGELQITSLLIEGGSTVNAAALSAEIVDKIYLYYAPKIFGEAGSVPFANPNSSFDHGLVKNVRIHLFGDDIAVEGYLRDPYAS